MIYTLCKWSNIFCLWAWEILEHLLCSMHTWSHRMLSSNQLIQDLGTQDGEHFVKLSRLCQHTARVSDQWVHSDQWILSRGYHTPKFISFLISSPISFSSFLIHPNFLWRLPLEEHRVDYLQMWFLTGNNPLTTQGTSANFWRHFGCQSWGRSG